MAEWAPEKKGLSRRRGGAEFISKDIFADPRLREIKAGFAAAPCDHWQVRWSSLAMRRFELERSSGEPSFTSTRHE